MERVLELTAEAVDADAISALVMPNDRHREEFEVSFARRGGNLQRGAVSISLGLSGHILETGEATLVDDVSREPRFRGKVDSHFGTQTRTLIAVPMRRRDRLEGLMEAIRERPVPFTRDDLEFVQAVAAELAVAIENARLIEELRWDVQASEMLLSASRKVGSSLELGAVLEHLLEALAVLIPYDAGGIFLLGEKGELRRIEHRGYPAGTEALLRERPDKGITRWVAQNRQSINVGNVRQDPRYIEARPTSRSQIAAPIVWGDRVIGVITLESDLSDAFSGRQLTLIEMIAAQVASAIANARFFEAEMGRARIDHELELSREIQCALYPRRPLRHGPVEAVGVNVPSSTVGGDYFDYYQECSGHIGLAIADAAGHGLSASLLMAAMRSVVHFTAGTCPTPGTLSANLNRLLYESTPANQFVAAVLGSLDIETGKLNYTNAGHTPPVLIGEHGDRRLEGGGLILGAFPDSRYEEREVQIEPGDLLVFYTDGLTELVDPDGEEFGIGRLANTIREHRDVPLEELLQAVREAARQHSRGTAAVDDVTLMLVRWRDRD